MAHAAGLDDAIVTPAWLDERRRDRSPVPVQRRAFAAALLAVPPGAGLDRYHYANTNFVVLGAAIEAATGLSWEAAMRRHLFDPLRPAGVADHPAVLWPSGRVHLPPGDYARFLQLFLAGGAPLLAPATLHRLLTPPVSDLPYADGWLRTPPGALTHTGSIASGSRPRRWIAPAAARWRRSPIAAGRRASALSPRWRRGWARRRGSRAGKHRHRRPACARRRRTASPAPRGCSAGARPCRAAPNR